MRVPDLYDSAGAESPWDSLLQGHLGLDSQKTWCRLSKQSSLFAFLQGNCCLIMSYAFGNPSLGERSKGNIFPHSRAAMMTGLFTDARLDQGCSGVVLPMGWQDTLLFPLWVEGRGSCGAGAPTCLAPCLCGHLSSPAGNMHPSDCYSHGSERKIK